MFAEGRVMGAGDVGISDGNPVTARYTKHNAAAIADAAGHFYEYGIRGRLFHGNTPSAGVAPVATISTVSMACVANPRGSGVNLAILSGSLIYQSGTLPSGAIFWCSSNNLSDALPTAAGATAGVVKNAQVGGRLPAAQFWATATVVAPTIMRNFCTIAPMLATSVLAPFQFYDLVDGSIIVPPGGVLSFQGILTATTGALNFGMMWAEEPI
jgi:hypothetical protein